MKKTSCDFCGMIPTIVFNDRVLAEIIPLCQKHDYQQVVVIAKVAMKNNEIEFHCNKLMQIDENDDELAENEAPIFLAIMSPSDYETQSVTVDNFIQEYERVMTDTTNGTFNANNIYSIFAEATYLNKQMHVRFSLFCPKATVDIEETGTSNTPSQPSVPVPAYQILTKQKDPKVIKAIFYGVNRIDDPRIFSLSCSIYMQYKKKICAVFNSKVYTITVHSDNEYDILRASFAVTNPITKIVKFTNQKPEYQSTQSQVAKRNKKIDSFEKNNNDISMAQYVSSAEFTEVTEDLKQQIITLQNIIIEKDRMYQDLLRKQNEEVQEMLSTILSEVKRNSSLDTTRNFSRRSIIRRPVVVLSVSESNIYENKSVKRFFIIFKST